MADGRIKILFDNLVIVELGLDVFGEAPFAGDVELKGVVTRLFGSGITRSSSSLTSRLVFSYSWTASSTSIWVCRS